MQRPSTPSHPAVYPSLPVGRRLWLQSVTSSGAALSLGALAQSPGLSGVSRPDRDGERPCVVAQLADMSAEQQDVSRDFLVGSRAAWQDLNARGGVQGRPVQHVIIETDGTASGLQAAWQAVQRQTACVALSGCVGNAAASGLLELQSKQAAIPPIPVVAPWLHNAAPDTGTDHIFEVFPDHPAQITHAVKTLASMGVQHIGVVFANAQIQRQSRAYITQAANAMSIGLQMLPLPSPGSASPAVLRTPSQTIVLFMGGTPELYDFVRQLVLAPGRQCYVVALADVNLQVLSQMGGAPKNVSIIATQAVPMATSALPVVRAYREALARFFDEPPSPQGLAGFIAARYTADVMQGMSGNITRATLLTALQRRSTMNVGGFAVAYQGRKRTHGYVTQSMLTPDGRIVG